MNDSKSYYYTGEIARAVGVHPNTVHLYEKWHFIPPVPRDKNKYRLYSRFHLEQMRLARIALPGPYPANTRIVVKLIKLAAAGHLHEALALTNQFREIVQTEKKHAQEAAEKVEKWLQSLRHPDTIQYLNITRAARLLDVTTDTLRTWERNGLLRVPRNKDNQYRTYGKHEIETLKAIKMLRRAGYSIMSILRMLKQVEKGTANPIIYLLNTPNPNDDICYATDRLLSFLAEHEQRAQKIAEQLNRMIAALGDRC